MIHKEPLRFLINLPLSFYFFIYEVVLISSPSDDTFYINISGNTIHLIMNSLGIPSIYLYYFIFSRLFYPSFFYNKLLFNTFILIHYIKMHIILLYIIFIFLFFYEVVLISFPSDDTFYINISGRNTILY